MVYAMLVARLYLRKWFLAPWPERDINHHVVICNAINRAVQHKLLTKQDVCYLLRYLAGYGDRDKEKIIRRGLLVVSTLAELPTTEQYTRNHMQNATELQIQTKVKEIESVSLWEQHESNYF